MAHVSQLFERNQEYVTTHKALPYFSEFPEGTKLPDIIIYACLDMRVDPEAILGLKPGDAFVVRNAGGNIQRNIDDLMFLDQLLGLKEVLLIKHTNCGATQISEDALHDGLKKIAPDHADEIDNTAFGTFTDVPGAAIESVKFVKTHSLIRKELRDNTTGAVYDIKTGRVTRVDV